jgi:hypothetical protein
MGRILVALLMWLVFQVGYTDEIPKGPNRILPPHPTAPRFGPDNLFGTDSYTQSRPASQMNTIKTQSVGTSGNYNPESHPIPLAEMPVESLD